MMTTELAKSDREVSLEEFEKRVQGYRAKVDARKFTLAKALHTGEVVAGAAVGVAIHNKASAGAAFFAGVGLNVLGYMGLSGEAGDHLNALGDGVLASTTTILMLGDRVTPAKGR
jgi:hypothetical protein